MSPGTYSPRRSLNSTASSFSWAAAGRAAVQKTLLGRAWFAAASRRSLDIAEARGQRRKYRFQVLHRLRFTTDHQAVTAFQAEHTTAGADVDVVDPRLGESLSFENA